MTNKEAIQILAIVCGKQLLRTASKEDDEKLMQAFEMAITALRDSEPNWEKAPRRANYYSIDGDGSRWWYEYEPTRDGNNFDQSRGDFIKDINPDRMKLFKRPEL